MRSPKLDVYIIESVSQLWRNAGSGFVNETSSAAPGLPGVREGSEALAEYDNDGRLDLLLTGFDCGTEQFISQLWRDYTAVTNTPPSGPTSLSITATDADLRVGLATKHQPERERLDPDGRWQRESRDFGSHQRGAVLSFVQTVARKAVTA